MQQAQRGSNAGATRLTPDDGATVCGVEYRCRLAVRGRILIIAEMLHDAPFYGPVYYGAMHELVGFAEPSKRAPAGRHGKRQAKSK
jgi:hypothetical protein